MTRYQREALANMITCAALIAANFAAGMVLLYMGRLGGASISFVIGLVLCWRADKARKIFVGIDLPPMPWANPKNARGIFSGDESP